MYSFDLIYNIDIDIDKLDYKINDNKIVIDNFILFINKHNLIYKISSLVDLEPLLDFLYNYRNLTIKKIYYILIIKYLSLKKYAIQNEYWFSFKKKYYNKLLSLQQFYICNNNEIIITSPLNFNICFIINNISLQKSFITFINNISKFVYELLNNSFLYINSRFEDIKIMIIGGTVNNINIIIDIYKILKGLKLSKMIDKTYLFNLKPLKRIKYDSNKNKIKLISSIHYYKFIDLIKQS